MLRRPQRLEIGQAQALLTLRGCRALTLLGPGGIGKSRLAQQLMARLRRACLPAARTGWNCRTRPAAGRAGAPGAGSWAPRSRTRGDPVEQLLRQLPQERQLLVLDNAEHLQAS
jgi:predicted ATPase